MHTKKKKKSKSPTSHFNGLSQCNVDNYAWEWHSVYFLLFLFSTLNIFYIFFVYKILWIPQQVKITAKFVVLIRFIDQLKIQMKNFVIFPSKKIVLILQVVLIFENPKHLFVPSLLWNKAEMGVCDKIRNKIKDLMVNFLWAIDVLYEWFLVSVTTIYEKLWNIKYLVSESTI